MTRYTQWCAVTHKHLLSEHPHGEWVRYADIGNCGVCAHANHEEGGTEVLTQCTNRNSFHAYRVMPRTSRCKDWAAPDA